MTPPQRVTHSNHSRVRVGTLRLDTSTSLKSAPFVGNMFTFTFVFVMSLALLSTAFRMTSTRSISGRPISMSLWGVKRLGQSVLGKSVASGSVGTTSTGPFPYPVTGTGVDDRHPLNTQDDDSYSEVSIAAINFMKHDILSTLQHPHVAQVIKLDSITDAIATGLLPDSSVMRASCLHSGGLMKDWDM